MPDRPATYRDVIEHQARDAGIPPELAFAIVDQESGGTHADETGVRTGQPTPSGQAQGFFQLMPETAAQYGVDPTDPIQNIKGGISFLKDLNSQYNGDVGKILAGYHGGPDVRQHGPKTQAYVQSIMGRLTAGMKSEGKSAAEVTSLTPAEETQFQGWAKANQITDVDQPGSHYDYRGYWRDVASKGQDQTQQQADGRHFPDTYKQHGHPTFSVESKYSTGPNDGGRWQGETYIPPAAGQAAPGAALATPVPSRTTVTGKASHRVTGEAAAAVGAPPPTPLPQYGSKASLLAQRPPNPQSLESGVEEQQSGIMGDTGLLAAVDPRTETGRRNIVSGGLAAVTGGMAGQVAGWAPIVYGALGAGVGGGLESALEGNPPATNVENAAIQGGLELGGRGAIWGLQNVGRRLIAHPVAKAASTKLTAAREATMSAFDDAIDAVKGSQRALKQSTGQAVESARATGQQGVQTAIAGKQSAQAAAAKPYEDLLANPPPRQAAGVAATRVVQGPAKSTLSRIGEGVTAAAESGPEVATAPLKEKIAELSAQITPKIAKEEAVPAAFAGMSPGAISAIREQAPEAYSSMLPQEHPIRGVLGQIQTQLADAGDSIPFAEAHKMKRALDEAVNWDRTAKSQVEQVTKGFRQTLRSEMSGHAPYEEATTQYATASKLFRTGHGKTIMKMANEEPSAFISRIDPKKPQSAAMLKELLVDLPDQGGDQAAASQGQRAWDAVRASWTHERVIKGAGGIAKLGDRIAAVEQTPEFAQTFYGDAKGQQILQNLKDISTAYQDAVAKGRVDVAAARASAPAGVATAKRIGGTQQAAEAARLDQLRRQRATANLETGKQMQAFSQSSIATSKERGAIRQHLTDLVRLGALGPTTYLGAAALGRLAMGPAASDLVTWAAYGGTTTTKALTRLFTSQVPGAAAADVLRLWESSQGGGGGELSPELERAIKAGSAPPAVPPAMRQLLGQPPPTAPTAP